MARNGEKVKYFITIILIISLSSCKDFINDNSLDTFEYPVSREFNPNESLFCNMTSIIPEYSQKNRSLKADNSSFSSYVSVIDRGSLGIISQQRVDDLVGWYNSNGIYSEFSQSYYHFVSGNSSIYKFNSKDGRFLDILSIQSSPGIIVNEVSKNGYLLINHAIHTEAGFRISIIDTKSDSLLKDDLFLPTNVPWSYSIYHREMDSYYFVIDDTNYEGGIRSLVYKLDLNDFSIDEVLRTDYGKHISSLQLLNNTLYFSLNSEQTFNETSQIWERGVNHPRILEFEIDSSTINEYYLEGNYDDYFFFDLLKKGEKLVTLSAITIIEGAEGYGENKISEFNPITKEITPVSTNSLNNLHWNTVIDDSLGTLFISYQGGYCNIRIVDLNDYTIVKEKKIVLY